MHKIKLSR